MKIKRINEIVLTETEVSHQVVLDVLFDMGAKILNAQHDKVQSEILIEYKNQTAAVYFFNQSKKLQISHGNVLIKSLQKIKSIEDLVSVLSDLLKRVF